MTTTAAAAAATMKPPAHSFSLKSWMMGSAKQAPTFLLLDGGVSTHLERSGAFPNRELWSSSLLLTEDGRKRIRQGHDDWIRHGTCDILSTVTYQCHYGTYSQDARNPVLPPAQMTDLMTLGVQLVKDAVVASERSPLFVVVSTGCYGAALADGSEYTGNYGSVTDEQLQEFHSSKLDTYLAQQPDGIAIETIPSLRECECICQVLEKCMQRDDHSSIAIWISFACRNESELNDGSRLSDALNLIHRAADYVQGIGLNCCHGEHLKSLLRIVRDHPASKGKAIAVYPNSGETWNAKQETWQPGTAWGDTAQDFASNLWDSVKDIHDHPLILGGCCRTTPEAIAALRKLAEKESNE